MLLSLHHDVVHVNVDVAAELQQQTFLHAALEGGVGVLQPNDMVMWQYAPKGVMKDIFRASAGSSLIW